ncbi:MAG: hypothetical protein IT565_08845 [Rhodospirillales bacterium]|nr:hypothetical protein [Rhodospirillales bacterium]
MNPMPPPATKPNPVLYAIVAILIALLAGGGFFGYQKIVGLQRDMANCSEAGCKSLAEQLRSLKGGPAPAGAALAPAQGEGDMQRLKEALKAAEEGRDQLAAQAQACGAEGCQSLAGRLAKAEKDVQALKAQVKKLRDQVAALGQDNQRIKDELAKEFSSLTGQRLLLKEIVRIGPFAIGSFEPSEAQLAELKEALATYKNTPLLVVGVADHRPYQAPSAELKQLGLMLARAEIVKSQGYEVYYQVRRNDPGVPESRGLVVYQMGLQSKAVSALPQENAVSMAMPAFYTNP